MAKPAPKLREKDEAGVSQLARTLADALTENPTIVPTPKVTPTQLEDAAQELDDAVQALADYDAGRQTFVTTVENKRTVCEGLITKSCDDSAVQTSYDKTKLTTLKVPLQGEATAPDTSKLQNFNVSHGDHEGYVDGGANRRDRAKLYRVRRATIATGPWTTVYEGSASQFTVQGEPVGELCYYQMQAFVGGVWTEWSDIAQLRIV